MPKNRKQDKKNAFCCCTLRFCFPMRETRHRFAWGKEKTVRYEKLNRKDLQIKVKEK